jgi:hypothetical protein
MKKQFILTVIVIIGILSIVNGQNFRNLNDKFLINKNHQYKTELQKENHAPFSSYKKDIKDIQQYLKETNVYTKKLDSIVRYEYDDVIEQLLPYSLYEFIFSANNNLTSEIYSEWDENTNSWIYSDKGEYTYDANNNITSEIYSEWDASTNSWIYNYKYEYTYDASNNLTSEIHSNWDTSINSWIFNNKNNYTYDANNNLTSEIYSYWDASTNSWIYLDKVKYTYDANNNLTSVIYSYWDESTNSWIYSDKDEYTYDLSVSIDNVLVSYALESNNPILSYYYYNYDGSDFVLDGKDIYYYSDITGINEIIDNYNVSIYPNPANDYLMINTTTNENLNIEIYTITGQSVKSTECTNNASEMRVDISQLPAGMYFIRIANDQNNITKKFVKE